MFFSSFLKETGPATISTKKPNQKPTALDHWFFDAYNFRLKSSGNSTEFKMRNRRHLALDPAPSLDLDLLLGGFLGA